MMSFEALFRTQLSWYRSRTGASAGKTITGNFFSCFLKCEDLDEARRLSAHVFGIQRIQHFKTIEPREEDSINNSIYEEEPALFLLKPHTRNYRERKDKRGFENKAMEKMLQREAYLRQTRKQKEIVLHYIKDRQNLLLLK